MHSNTFFLNKNDVVIVIVDIQERLAAVMGERQKVIDNCLHLITASGLFHIPLVITEQYPKGLGTTVKEIRDAAGDSAVIEKIDFSCCGEQKFLDTLASFGRKKIILVGMETHVCVLQTCLGLLQEGYIVHIARDAVCSRKKDDYKTGIEFLRDAGVVITCTETILFQLLEKAGSEEFKIISKRIR